MKKVILLVAVFLVGNATQTFAQHHQNVIINPGTNDRYCNSNDEIRFVEDGVLYRVTTDGRFDFQVLRNSKSKYKKGKDRKNHPINYYTTEYNAVRYNYGGKHYPKVKKDRYGNIYRIGKTEISYSRNGKVKNLGCVPLFYHRGRLVQAGNMEIVYNRFGDIRNTIGYINKYNRDVWHDDWTYKNEFEYGNNTSYYNQNTRIRTK